MKIAIPSKNDKVDGHFGHCEYYNVYTIDENNTIIKKTKIDSLEGCGCKSEIASVLKEKGVKLMLAGNMGDGALNKLNSSDIKVIRGCSGEVDKLISDYLNGNIEDSGKSCKQHEIHHLDDGLHFDASAHSCKH